MPRLFLKVNTSQDEFSEEFLLRLEDIRRITRDTILMHKHDDNSYDEEGLRKVSSWDIYFHTRDDYVWSETYKTEAEFDARWKQLQEFE